MRRVNDRREIILIIYYNVYFYLSFQVGKDEISKQCLVKVINAGMVMNMKDLVTWCDKHQIPFIMKFKYRKDYSMAANLWNLYSYFRFYIERSKFRMK